MKIKTFYRNKLPHIQQIGATFFVTFRLFGSIPKVKLQNLIDKYNLKFSQLTKIQDEKERNIKISLYRQKLFGEYDRILHKTDNGPDYLKQDNIAKIVSEQLHRFDNEFYDLICYSIMSNHVHILIDLSTQLPQTINDYEKFENYTNLDIILKKIKGASAYYINRALGLSGQLWDRNNYDTYIRNEKMSKNIISYILNNPVKAKIVNEWKDYKWNYYKYDEL